jgi:hypothetical protein
MNNIDLKPIPNTQDIERYLKRQRTLAAKEKRLEDSIREEGKLEDIKEFDNNLEKGWEGILNTVEQKDSIINTVIIEKEINTDILENFNTKFVSAEELQLLIEYFDDNDGLLSDLEGLHNAVGNCNDDDETGLLNNFISSTGLNKGQIYMAISYLMEKLRQNRQKMNFLRKLQKWIRKFETENSGYLFEFFSIVGNKNLKNTKSVDSLAKFSSQNNSAIGIKKIIEQVAIFSDNKFDNIVSLYMKIKVQELKAIGQHEILNLENKAKLSELITVEKNLILINSIINNQKIFFDYLTNEDIIDKTLWANINLKELLLGMVNLCDAGFIVKMTMDKYLNAILLVNLDNPKYIKVLYSFISMVKKLPKELFGYKLEKMRDFVDKLNIIKNDLILVEGSSKQNKTNSVLPNFISNKKQTVKKFI